MSNKLYVGGLSWDTSEDALRAAFTEFGEVEDISVITDRETGRSRGFGFVTFTCRDDANRAISSLDGTVLDGRNITVNVAREKTNRGGGRNYGGGRNQRY